LITPEKYWESDLDTHRRIGWYPITTRRKCTPEDSKFSGIPMLYADEIWPICPGCKRPMHFLLQINQESLPEDASYLFDSGCLQIFYCIGEKWDCEESVHNFEAFSKGALVRILNPDVAPIEAAEKNPVKSSFPELAIVGWQPQTDYPNSEDAGRLGTKIENDQIEHMDQIDVPRSGDKLLGWAAWQQGCEYPQCPECKNEMRFIFQLDSKDNIPLMFGDVGTAYVTQCELHKDILALTWACG